jgi:hypothetical protein
MLPRVLANWTTGALGENAEGGVLRKGGELDASWSGKVAKESQEMLRWIEMMGIMGRRERECPTMNSSIAVYSI